MSEPRRGPPNFLWVLTLEEEIGVTLLVYGLTATIDDPVSPSTRYHLYAVTRWSGEPTILDDEHSELKWITLSAASVLQELALEDYRVMFAGLAGNNR